MLATLTPVASVESEWGDGAFHIRTSAYPAPAELPDELVSSVRCIVRVGEKIVVCRNPHEFHMWPGGRREPGETFAETARREVHEETGWLIDESSTRIIGWLHHHHLKERPVDSPYQDPDFLNIVIVADATERGAEDWTDVEGYELSSQLMTPDEAHELMRAQSGYPILKPFLDLLQ